MKKTDVIAHLIPRDAAPKREKGLGFAPSNIALCKYWGKRDAELNLPITSSISIALPEKGALTALIVIDKATDEIILNGEHLASTTAFVERTRRFLNLFRLSPSLHFRVDIKMNIPVAAGLASSACGFASLVSALNDLFAWELPLRELSILARLGSGSAARSLWNGFVEWHAGVQADGMDSFAEPLDFEWPELRLGLLLLSTAEKKIPSRVAMQRTVNSSTLYAQWPKKCAQDLIMLRQALELQNFALLGGTAESNALTMHATILSCWPPISYFMPETIAMMQKIWQLRSDGLALYFTEDAGPNLKLLFLQKDEAVVMQHFAAMEVLQLFE